MNELRELRPPAIPGDAATPKPTTLSESYPNAYVLEIARDCFLRSFELLQRRRRRDLNTLSKLHDHMARMPVRFSAVQYFRAFQPVQTIVLGGRHFLVFLCVFQAAEYILYVDLVYHVYTLCMYTLLEEAAA